MITNWINKNALMPKNQLSHAAIPITARFVQYTESRSRRFALALGSRYLIRNRKNGATTNNTTGLRPSRYEKRFQRDHARYACPINVHPSPEHSRFRRPHVEWR